MTDDARSVLIVDEDVAGELTVALSTTGKKKTWVFFSHETIWWVGLLWSLLGWRRGLLRLSR